MQHESSTDMFQLPPGVLPEVPQETRAHVPMEEGSNQSQPQPQSDLSELLQERQNTEQQSYPNKALTDNFLNSTTAGIEATDNHKPLVTRPDSPQLTPMSDSFSFQQSNLGIPKTEGVFAINSSYSDSIVSQFLENMSAALQNQSQEPISTNSGNFSTSLTTVPTQTHNQITMSAEVRHNAEKSDNHLFNNESTSVASMDFSLNSSPVHIGLQSSQSHESHPIPSDSSFKEIFGNNILSNLDHLQLSLDKGSVFSPEQVVPSGSQVHLPTDTLTSAREVSYLIRPILLNKSLAGINKK